MPSKSKAQQKFMGLVHAYKKGELADSEVSQAVKDAAKSMKDKDAKDYASTKHKGLPTKVKSEGKIEEILQLPLQSFVADVLPGSLFNVRDEREREELHKTLTDLRTTLNSFYKRNRINMKVK